MFSKTSTLVCFFVVGIIAAASPAFAQSVADENRLAAGFYSREQWAETVIAFKKLIQDYPDSQEANNGHFFLAEALSQQGNFQQAYGTYQIFLQKNPQHQLASRATFRMGEAAYRVGNDQQAIRLLEIFIKQNPHENLNEFALPYLGELRLRRLEPQLAQRAYETALKLYPYGSLASKCRMGLAKAFEMQGAYPDAIRFYQFIAEQTDNPLAGEAELQLGNIYIKQSDFVSAEKHLLNALPLCDNPEAQCEASYWLARTYGQKNDFEKALAILESVVGKPAPDPLASAIYFDGAMAASKLGKITVANQWLTELVQKYPKSELADDALHLRIDQSFKSDINRKNIEVQQLADQFVELFPNSRLKPAVLETAGRNQYASQQYKKSVGTFNGLLTEDLHFDPAQASSDRANWLYLQSLGYIGLREFANAESSLNRIDIGAASEELKPLYQIALATARFGQQKYQHAIPNYRAYLQSANQSRTVIKDVLRARTELTVCLAESGLWSEVSEAFNQLQKHHTDSNVLLETTEYLADKASRNHQPEFAIRCYEMLTSPQSKPATVARALSGIAWLKLESGDVAGAMLVFDRLISEFPNSELTGAAAMARAKAFDDATDYRAAAQMYGLIIRNCDQTDFANVARLRRAYAKQKLGTPSDLTEAKILLQEYMALPVELPAKDEALYQLGWVNFDLKLPHDAIENFRELRQRYPDSKYLADATFRLAQHEVQQNHFDEATRLLESLKDQSNVPDAIEVRCLYLIGEVAAKQNQWEIVGRTMTELLQRSKDPKLNTRARYWLAESNYRQQQFSEAAANFELLKDDHQGLENKLEPWIWLRLAQCQGQQSDWSDARLTAEEGQQQCPEFSASYEFDFIIARGLEDIGKLTDARAMYQKVIDSTQGGATETAAIAQWRIGESFFHQEKYAEAIQAYYNVDSLFTYTKWRAASMLQAGKCQEHLGNWQHAKKLYTRLIELFPDSEHSVSAQRRLVSVEKLANQESFKKTETR